MSSKRIEEDSDEYTPTPESSRPKSNISDITRGRRGRPRGNPKPLNAEQRRQRNADLERLRRQEIGEAYKELNEFIIQTEASSSSIPDNYEIPRKELIQKTIAFINRNSPSVEDIKKEIKQMEEMIRELEKG